MLLPFTAAVQTQGHSDQMGRGTGRWWDDRKWDSACPKAEASSEFQPLVALGGGRPCC